LRASIVVLAVIPDWSSRQIPLIPRIRRCHPNQ
jgi:hypothetical protein